MARTVNEKKMPQPNDGGSVSQGNGSPNVRPRGGAAPNANSSEMHRVSQEILRLVAASRQGLLEERGKVDEFQGVPREMIHGINEMLEVHERVQHVIATLSRSRRRPRGPGRVQKIDAGPEHETLIPSVIIGMMESVGALVGDVNLLTHAAEDGNLSVRGDGARHCGAYREVVEGVNKTLDAVLLPIKESCRVLGMIRAGDLRARVEMTCKGDHAKMKDSVNGVHTWLTEMVAYVTKLANGDLSATMAEASENDQTHEWLMLLKTRSAPSSATAAC